jgi:hypothetical protein
MPKSRSTVSLPIASVPLRKPAAAIKPIEPIPPLKAGAQPIKKFAKVARRGRP